MSKAYHVRTIGLAWSVSLCRSITRYIRVPNDAALEKTIFQYTAFPTESSSRLVSARHLPVPGARRRRNVTSRLMDGGGGFGTCNSFMFEARTKKEKKQGKKRERERERERKRKNCCHGARSIREQKKNKYKVTHIVVCVCLSRELNTRPVKIKPSRKVWIINYIAFGKIRETNFGMKTTFDTHAYYNKNVVVRERDSETKQMNIFSFSIVYKIFWPRTYDSDYSATWFSYY